MTATNKNTDIIDFNKLTEEQKDLLAERIKINHQHIKYPINEKQGSLWEYKFWKEQPVKYSKNDMVHTNVISNQLEAKDNIQLTPMLEWWELNVNNEQDMDDMSSFLSDNYLEDSTGKFKLYYTPDFLKWVIRDGIVVGIRRKDNKKTVGTVAGTVKTFQINDQVMKMVEVNFLCLNKKIRKHGLAEKLILEIKNKFLQQDIKVGFFTTERYVPTPFSKVKYFHRPINYLKLYKTGFVHLEDQKQLDSYVSKYKLQNTLPKNVVPMTETHLEKVYELYYNYMDMYNFYERYTLEDLKYWFLNEHTRSYVVLSEKNNEVVDFYSMYILPTVHVPTEMKKNTVPIFIMNAYLFTYTATTYTSRRMMDYVILSAEEEGCDLVTASNSLENNDIVDEPGGDYLPGTGLLHYNFYNLETPVLHHYQICKVVF